MTDGRTDRQTDGGVCNIPIAFLKQRGDNYRLRLTVCLLTLKLNVPVNNFQSYQDLG